MSNNDLRTKVTDLPICTDIEQLDTILGIGKDNAMYRVDSENIGGGGKWIPLTATITSGGGSAPMSLDSNATSISIDLVSSEIQEAYNIGGKIHVIVFYSEKNMIYEDIEFLISPSYALPEASDLDDNTELGRKYIIPYITPDDMDIIYASLYYNGLMLQGVTLDNNPITFEFVGIFFEPIKNIGDLSKVSKDGSSSPA